MNNPFLFIIGDPEWNGFAIGFTNPLSTDPYYLHRIPGGYLSSYQVWTRMCFGIYIGRENEALYHKLKKQLIRENENQI